MLQCIRSQAALQRRWNHTGISVERDLTDWINAKSKTHYSLDVVSVSRLNILFGILPTRGRKEERPLMKLVRQAPKVGKKLPLGHHLGILPDKYANSLLRSDGSPPWHAPPSPFNRRQWLGGSFIISAKSPPSVGINFLMKGIYLTSKRMNSEVQKHTKNPRTVEVRQRLILSQWYPNKTDLLIEERVTEYSSQPYDCSAIKTTSLIPPKVGILSFVFTPNPSMLQAFASLCENTHRIHFDRVYANSEGYPDLVVQVPLQLIVILDVMRAYIPDGLLFRAVDYRVINPLFSGRKIKVYRQWIHAIDKEDDSPVSLEDLLAQTTPPVFKFQSSKDSEKTPRRAHHRRQGQRSRNKRMALFWTATDDGIVGTVALVILVPRPGKRFWKLDTEGYLARNEDSESHKPQSQESNNTQHPDDNNVEDDLTDDSESHTSAEPFPKVDGLRGFDSLGRPITDRIVSGQELSTDQSQQSRHPWTVQDLDEVALEEERLERIRSAEALVKSRDLLRRLYDNEDEDYII